jgi:long-chain acyl-CoA synthetase
VLPNGLNVYPEDVEIALQARDALKDAVVIGLEENGQGPEVHAVLLMEDGDRAKAKAMIQQANKQLAPHQQIKSFTIWPEQDFPRTHTLKVKRQEVLAQLSKLREQNLREEQK